MASGSPVSQPQRRPRGIGFALGAAVLFGFSTPCAKVLLSGAHPAVVAALLYLGAGIGLATVRIFAPGPGGGGLMRRDVPWLTGAVVVGGALGPLLLMAGLRATPASTASLLLNLESVFTVLIAWRAFREHIDRRLVVGMALIVLAGAFLSWQGGILAGTTPWGPLGIVGACLCWAIDNNLTRRVSEADARLIVAIKGTAAGALNLVLAVVLGVAWPSLAVIIAALVLGFVSYGVSLVLFVLALRHLGTMRTGAYFALAPFVGAGASLALLGERPGAAFWPATALMGVGLWLHLAERHAHQHRHPPLAHAHAHEHDEHHQHDHPPGVAAVDGHDHWHEHAPLVHAHPHYPDVHHRHAHDDST